MHLLGTDGLRKLWANPCHRGAVSVQASGVLVGDPSDVIDPRLELFRTTAVKSPWVRVSLHTVAVCPTHYTLGVVRGGAHRPTCWVLQASLDKRQWRTLDSRVGDGGLLGDDAVVATYVIHDAATSYYRHFQVVLTDVNISGNHILSVSGFELFGAITVL